MPVTDQAITAAADAVGLDTLERLARLDAHGHPILSVYVDLDPTRFPTPDTRGTELGALLDDARRQGGEKDADRVQTWLNANPAIGRGARGLALFSSAPTEIFEIVPLPTPVEPLTVLDTVPWLEPLAAMISPGDWGVAVVSRRAARLLRGGPGGLSEFATVAGDLHRRHAQGGWSQARFQRGIEEQVAAHVRGVADRLLRAHLRRPFQQLVIVCSDELRPVIERSLSRELIGVLAGMVDADLEHVPVDEIAGAIAPVIERIERNRERDLIAQLEQALGTGGRAAAGLDEVLSTLEQQQVQTLLVGQRGNLKAGLCPTCGRLLTDGGRRCPLDGASLAEVDAIEHAVDAAARQSVQVIVARYEQAWLHEHGDIAALLRW
ncbi:MAG: baeRF10 domain-containing protein [Solirubrobacteraceae bacterium]